MRPLTKHGGLIRTLIATEDWRDEAAENREADLRAERDALAERVEALERAARRVLHGGSVIELMRALPEGEWDLRADDEARGALENPRED